MIIFSEIIKKKRDGFELSKKDIENFIRGYMEGKVTDYQVSAFCMAVYFKGMSKEETKALTEAIAYSGKLLDLSDFYGPKLDKHSTGGVGDKVSLVLIPLMASCGFLFPKLSGRGLGFTGGTLDKIESIPGFKTNLSLREIKNILGSIGLVIAGQTEELAPADKRIYALRDVTATAESIPFIVSSILGKKLASGTDIWVFDVKLGKGAFLKNFDKAKELAELLVSISKEFGKKSCAIITDMNQPLGYMVGNSLEVEEAIATLKGNGPPDLEEVVLSLGVALSELAGRPLSREFLCKKLKQGEALVKFLEMIEAQGGNSQVIENPKVMPFAPYSFVVESNREGFITSLDAEKIGLAILVLGGGRLRMEDDIDRGVGIKLLKKEGDMVSKEEPLAEIFYRSAASLETAIKLVKEAYNIEDKPISGRKLIYEKVL
ncbi:MAG: thymidine phosphorylase [Synergistetes bacterium]|nr:thymidine phosphorylase [Synergistota bacterium]MCX8128221.1 thymidine phosphorylase [Synergistota bacterium]MDW8192668.1 thymidine phosphorylase [Synergistota bacterium]